MLRLLEKKPWNRFEFAADARRAWERIRPAQAATLEEIVQSLPELARRSAGPCALARARHPEPAGPDAPRAPGRAPRAVERRRARDVRGAAAGPHRPHRRSRRRQEPHRRVAMRRGSRAGRDDPAPRALRPRSVAARRHHGRDQRALRPDGRRPRDRRADTHGALGGREGRRRGAHLGRGHRRVAAADAARTCWRPWAPRASASSSTGPSCASASSSGCSSASRAIGRS